MKFSWKQTQGKEEGDWGRKVLAEQFEKQVRVLAWQKCSEISILVFHSMPCFPKTELGLENWAFIYARI